MADDAASSAPLDVHYAKLEDWLKDRSSLLQKKHAVLYQAALDAAPRMLHLVRHELPSLRRAAARHGSAVEESARKLQETARLREQLLCRRQQELADRGLLFAPAATVGSSSSPSEHSAAASTTTGDVVDRIQRQAGSVAPVFDASVKLAAVVVHGRVLSFFDACQRRLDATTTTSTREPAGTDPQRLPPREAALLFPWITSLAQQPEIDSRGRQLAGHDDATAVPVAAEIDWGDLPADSKSGSGCGGEPPTAVFIDWGDAVAPAVIDWGDDVSSLSGAPSPSQVPAGRCLVTPEWRPVPRNERGVPCVRPHEAKARAHLLDECDALLSFLAARSLEDSVASDVANGGDASSTGVASIVMMPTSSDGGHGLPALREAVHSLRRALQDPMSVEALKLQQSHAHAERFLARLEQYAFTAHRQTTVEDEWRLRGVQAAADLAEATAQLQAVVANVKASQRHCEELLCKMFAPRPVQIVGDINTIA